MYCHKLIDSLTITSSLMKLIMIRSQEQLYSKRPLYWKIKQIDRSSDRRKENLYAVALYMVKNASLLIIVLFEGIRDFFTRLRRNVLD